LAAVAVCAARNVDRVDHVSLLTHAATEDPAGAVAERLSVSTFSGRLLIDATIFRGDPKAAEQSEPVLRVSSVPRGLRYPPAVSLWILDGVAADRFGFGYRSGVTQQSAAPNRYVVTSTMLMVPLWALCVPPTLILVLLLRRMRSTRRTRRHAVEGRCKRCGYDLRASKGRCPECGMESGNARIR
jgi:hypothetical protein